MPKMKQTPGAALNALLKKHKLNYNRLAKAIGMSSAMIRLIARDENPVSASAAFRFAKFFKTKPEFWMSLQTDFDISAAARNKKLARALKNIPTVDKAVFERKPREKKAAKAKKTVKSGKRGRPSKAASVRAKKAGRKPRAASKK